MSRSSLLQTLRPSIPSIKLDEDMGAEESFQNNTLRPLLKFQNELLLCIFEQYIEKHKSIFFQLTIPKRELFIRERLQKDVLLKNMCLGMIVGLFTVEEYKLYLLHEKEIKKRINEMLTQRIQSQIGYFE